MGSTLEAGGAAADPGLPAGDGTLRGGERGRWRRRTGAGSWLSPLPGSYSRIGTAGRLFAGRCPALTARAGSLQTFTGIIPAAACRPVHRQLARAGAAAPAPGRVVR